MQCRSSRAEDPTASAVCRPVRHDPAMAEPQTYDVTVLEEEGGPEAALRERFAVVAAYRLRSLDTREGHYPEVDGGFDMLDHFEGPYFWDRAAAALETDPPTRVDFEVVSVHPAERPAEPGVTKVTVRVPF